MIEYSVKELLQAIRDDQSKGFARLEGTMARKSDLARLEGRMDAQERRVAELEEDRRLREARAKVHAARDAAEAEAIRRRWSVRERVLLAASAVAVGAGTLLAVLH